MGTDHGLCELVAHPRPCRRVSPHSVQKSICRTACSSMMPQIIGGMAFHHPFTTPSNPKSSIAASWVSSVNFSSYACAMSNRSNGSACVQIRLRAASMWRGKIGNRIKPCASSCSVIEPCGNGNLPLAFFSTISHTLAVLTTISDFAMVRCVALPKRASAVIHQ